MVRACHGAVVCSAVVEEFSDPSGATHIPAGAHAFRSVSLRLVRLGHDVEAAKPAFRWLFRLGLASILLAGFLAEVERRGLAKHVQARQAGALA